MSFVKKFGAIYKTDLKLLRRDPMLLYSVAMTLVFLLIVRYFKDRVGIYYPLLALLTLIFIPMIFGMIPGFMMADEKEDKTIQALKVIPISSEAFLAYRLTWASIMTVVLTGVGPYILDIDLPREGLLALMALFVLEVWIFGLLITVFSESRMQALTVSKVLGWFLFLPPLIKLIVVWRNLSTDWSKFTAFLPTYWIYRVFEGIPANDYSDFPIALVVHLAWLIPLVVLFRKRVL
ncbi:MAG: fluoroquinolone transport system permease protein [Thermococcaceae archaeon]|jgi:fluoroquinolone transport system permease protein|uniref:ABC transporter permease n=1 Tax=Thermococcus TaxID=2263 RepID=UPI0005B2D248|nr:MULTISPECIES: ABC transporter permease [Thermococcus]MDK2783077.1 fluoroquinolone transport system permease protein [Thermococcaceae archaeon]MCA6214641.1 ABC transporter permease [Thermococcus bergensis]MDK2853404.1 fluoroquinolone transport system permease protein [Thermococcaceae archaeon]MDK2983239.1 fluoroquinolone transport system permease protein [Thermococcaceae archaeon]MDN5320853.1 fluoroquinolone transport system permease protein [Thermococcaceae archaeon]